MMAKLSPFFVFVFFHFGSHVWQTPFIIRFHFYLFVSTVYTYCISLFFVIIKMYALFRYGVTDEEEKKKNAELLLKKTKEQLAKKEEQYTQ